MNEASLSRTNLRNHLFAKMRPEDWELIAPHLEAVMLKERQVVEVPCKPITHVYFIEIGVVSIVAVNAEDHRIEVGVIGNEGMTGVPLIMGDSRAQHSGYMQIAGNGYRMPATAFTEALRKSTTLTALMLKSAQAFMIQTAQLVEGLRLFAGGDVDFRGGLVHRPVVFGLAALGGIQPASDGAQMFFDPARGFRGFRFGAAHPGQHVLAVAAAGGAGRQAPGIKRGAVERCALVGAVIGHGRCLFAHVRKTAQNAARQPFPDRQSFAPGSGARSFPRFWRDAGYIPGKLCSHLESIAPHTRDRRYRRQDIV